MKKRLIIKKSKAKQSPHLWKIRSVVVLSVFVLPILFILMLVYSYLGLKLATFTLNKFIPELKIEQLDGSFNDLKLKGFDLELQGVKVKIDDASFSLSGLCLLQGRLCIKNFEASHVMVSVNTDEIEEDPDEIESNERWLLKMPLPIDLSKSHLTNVTVYVDDMQFGLDDFTGKAIWVNEKLYVYPAVAQGLYAIFADDGKNPNSAQQNKTSHDAKSQQLISQNVYDSISEFFNQPLIESLDLVNIPLDVNVTSLTGNNWLLHIGGQDIKFNHSSIQTEMINNHIMVKRLKTDVKSPYANGHISATGSIIMGNDWPVTTDINLETNKDKLVGNFSGKLLGELTAKAKVTGLNQLDFKAKVNFVEKYLPMMADFSSKYFRWPMTDNPVHEFNDMTFSLSGKAKNYQLATKATIKEKNQLSSAFDIAMHGNNEGIVIDKGTAQFLQGKVGISGSLNWFKGWQWDLTARIDQLDLSNELKDYPIKLQGVVETSGKANSNSWIVDLKKIELDGNINREKLYAAGAISIDANQLISADKFKLVWDKNSIIANGSMQKEGLVSQINLTSLSLINEDLSGEIYGDFDLKGTLHNPDITANININNLTSHDLSAKKGNIKGNVNYQDQASGQITFTGQGIDFLGQTINDMALELQGNEKNHHLKVDINEEQASFNSKLNGSFDKITTVWDVTVPELNLKMEGDNRWSIDRPLVASYNISQNIPTIAEHCWLNHEGKICLNDTFSLVKKNHSSLTINHIDLAKLPIPNNGETKLAGNVDGKITIQVNDKNKMPDIKLHVESKNVYIQQSIASQILPIPFDLFLIDALFSHEKASLDWDFSLNEFGKLSGNLQVQDPTKTKRLSGNMMIDNVSLSIINPLLDGNDHAAGVIKGRLNFSDSLSSPSIEGRLDLDSNEIQSSQLPIDITSALIGLNFAGKKSTIDGLLKTKDGDLNLEGNANWDNHSLWKAEVSVVGTAMAIDVPPMLKLTVIPKVKMEASQDELILSGTIDIPKGKILIESLPTTSIGVSTDEVMLDKNKQEIIKDKSTLIIHSNLEVILGNNVNINAFGLDAALNGKLSIRQNIQGFGVFGQIEIPNGRFHAYGQDLIIRKGHVIFSGPIDEPLMNIEAIRNPEVIDDNVTAGIRVSGLASNPQIEVFSDPALSKQETLSYLLNGQSLSSASAGNNDLMTTLLVSLGTAQGGKYLGNVGDLLGIKDLTLDTQGSGEGYQVVVSGYLLPNLQLKYGIGIFDSLATLTFRYRLLPKLYLEAISGVDQTLNFLYQFEF